MSGSREHKTTDDAGAPLSVLDPWLREGFTTTPNLVLRNPRIPSGPKLLYVYILSYASHGEAWPGQERISRELGAHKTTVIRWLKKLRDLGLLTWKKPGFGAQNHYFVEPMPEWLRPPEIEERGEAAEAQDRAAGANSSKMQLLSDEGSANSSKMQLLAEGEESNSSKMQLLGDDNDPQKLQFATSIVANCNPTNNSIQESIVGSKNNIDSSLIQQHINARRSRVKNKGGDEEKSAAAENKKQNLFALLVALGINSPLREKVLEKSTLEEFRACALYTTTLEKVRNPYLLAARWVAQDECAPPKEFVALARASVEEIVAEGKWAGLWTSPERFPWRLWFTDWESVRPVREQDKFVEQESVQIPPPTPAELLWHAALRKIRVQVPGVTFRTWFEDTCGLSLQEGTLVVAASSQQQAAWLETKFQNRVSKILTELAGESTRVRFVAREDSHEMALSGIRGS